jgi:hypothetical protein
VIGDSIDPFMSRQSSILKAGYQERIPKSPPRNCTYAIRRQGLSLAQDMDHFQAVLGGAFGGDGTRWPRRFGRRFAGH